jgi:hypothetical protein
MSKKTEQQVEDYIESALTGDNGVDITKSPTDPSNEKSYEVATGMNTAEAKEFEKAVAEEFGSAEVG